MKLLRHFVTMACLLAIPLAYADEKPAANAGDPAIPVYETAEKVKAMPAGKATVEHKETFFAVLRTPDGKKFTIGSSRGEQQVWHFVATALKKGETYEFPAAFLAYENGKFYGTLRSHQGHARV